MKGCAFCNLGSRVIKSNASALLFLSNPRRTSGHALVIPKRHISEPWKLRKRELVDIFNLIFFYEKKTVGKLGDGFEIRENFRPDIKEDNIKMDHIHFHIIPRNRRDVIEKKSIDKEYFKLFSPLKEKEKEMVLKILESRRKK